MNTTRKDDGTGGPSPKKSNGTRRPSGRAKSATGKKDVSQILQSAYRETLNEAVPSDMLDLLSKLD